MKEEHSAAHSTSAPRCVDVSRSFCSFAGIALAAVALPIAAADRTVTYEAPYAEDDVLINSAQGVLTLDESAYPVDAAHALSFTGLTAVAKSTTIFNGGFWDFGGGLFPTNAANDRTITLQNGAVVTNVASVPPLNHYRNKLNLLGASRLYVDGDAVIDRGEVSGTTATKSMSPSRVRSSWAETS